MCPASWIMIASKAAKNTSRFSHARVKAKKKARIMLQTIRPFLIDTSGLFTRRNIFNRHLKNHRISYAGDPDNYSFPVFKEIADDLIKSFSRADVEPFSH